MPKFAKKSTVMTAVPTSSMPDIIFQLLIFFMVTTVLRQFSGLDVELPDANKVQKLPSKRDVSTVWISNDSRIVIDDVSVSQEKLSDLRVIAYNKLAENPKLIISLKIDKQAQMGLVNKVQLELRKANTLRINYSAIPQVI